MIFIGRVSTLDRRDFLALGSALALVPAKLLAGEQDFWLVNRTGFTIDEVQITPHNSKDWGDDILGEGTLEDGKKVEIVFKRKEKAKVWDLRVEDESGTEYIWYDLNLLEISEVTLYYNKGKATATFK